jgi:hypothetical protein
MTVRVPGPDIVVGMSRRLYAACENLAAQDDQTTADLRAEQPQLMTYELDQLLDEKHVATREEERRSAFAERESDAWPLLRAVTRDGFERGPSSSWNELLRQPPAIDAETETPLLESATRDTYLAIDARTIGP